MADLTQEEWKKRYEADKNAVLLDVRSEGEYNQGHIPNTILIDIYKGQGLTFCHLSGEKCLILTISFFLESHEKKSTVPLSILFICSTISPHHVHEPAL